MQTLIVLFMLATIALSGWGIASSLDKTDTQITNFWGLVNDVDARVDNTTQNLQNLDDQLAVLQSSTATLDDNIGPIEQILAQATGGQLDPAVSSALNCLGSASSVIGQTREGIQEGINTVQQYMGDVRAKSCQ